MRRISTSSMILALGWRAAKEEGTLTVVFNSCRMYRYYKVPRRLYDEMLKAESKGQYFNRNIRGKFEYKDRGIWISRK